MHRSTATAALTAGSRRAWLVLVFAPVERPSRSTIKGWGTRLTDAQRLHQVRYAPLLSRGNFGRSSISEA